jgi:organic radical activating enzyme
MIKLNRRRLNCRLIFTEKCNRKCEGCCNKGFDFTKYPKWNWNEIDKWNMILISGGEPMLYPISLIALITRIKSYTSARIITYTADVKDIAMAVSVINVSDGITLTLHDQRDVATFEQLNMLLQTKGPYNKSLRLNVFDGIRLPDYPITLWDVKKNIKWIKDCPVPPNERLRIYDN